MDLYKEILIHALENGKMEISFPTLHLDVPQIVEGVCYRTLMQIREILDDGYLDDAECFAKIEEIVCTFEQIGSSGGCRHDFG